MKKSEGPDLKKQIFVIGAGASGLMAAIQAAVYGAAVTVLEQNDRPGRKICATGNGRCNMTNLNQDENAYRGSHPEFVKPIRPLPECLSKMDSGRSIRTDGPTVAMP